MTVAPEIINLRNAISAARACQEMSSMAIRFAQYNADTSGQTAEFASTFMDALGVDLGYEDMHTEPESLAVKKSKDVRSAAVFSLGVFGIRALSYQTGLIIGDRTEANADITNVLMLSTRRWVDRTSDQREMSPPVHRVVNLRVRSKEWQDVREHTVNTMAEPYEPQVYTSVYDADSNRYIIGRDSIGPLGVTTLLLKDARYRLPRTSFKSANYISRRQINAQLVGTRTFLSSDFDEYGSALYLEMIAAAFDKSTEYDELNNQHIASIPKQPLNVAIANDEQARKILGKPEGA